MLKGIKAISYLNTEEEKTEADVSSVIESLSKAGVLCEANTLAVDDEDVEYELLSGAKFAYAPRNKEAARRLHEDGTILFYNINEAENKTLRDFAPVLQYVDYLTSNDEAALELTDTDNCAAALRELGKVSKTPILNLGEQGALALVDGRPLLIPAVSSFKAEGDNNFLAGFMYGVNKNAGLEKCMQYANVFSALSASEITESKVEKMMGEYR